MYRSSTAIIIPKTEYEADREPYIIRSIHCQEGTCSLPPPETSAIDCVVCLSVGLQLRAYKNISDYVIVLLPTTLTTIINNNKPLHNIMLDVELLGSV